MRSASAIVWIRNFLNKFLFHSRKSSIETFVCHFLSLYIQLSLLSILRIYSISLRSPPLFAKTIFHFVFFLLCVCSISVLSLSHCPVSLSLPIFLCLLSSSFSVLSLIIHTLSHTVFLYLFHLCYNMISYLSACFLSLSLSLSLSFSVLSLNLFDHSESLIIFICSIYIVLCFR